MRFKLSAFEFVGEIFLGGKFSTDKIRLKIKNKDLPYKKRDHALFIAFAPYKNPRYSISVVVEHGGSGSKAAAPIARDLCKNLIDYL